LALVLFDHGTPRGIARSLTGHTVKQARAQGWDTLSNGALLDAAEAAGFDVLVTPDKNIRYQQNLTRRKIALVVLGNPQWPVLRLYIERVVAAVNEATPGSFAIVDIPQQ
jgi:hypothetical protein